MLYMFVNQKINVYFLIDSVLFLVDQLLSAV